MIERYHNEFSQPMKNFVLEQPEDVMRIVGIMIL